MSGPFRPTTLLEPETALRLDSEGRLVRSPASARLVAAAKQLKQVIDGEPGTFPSGARMRAIIELFAALELVEVETRWLERRQ